MERIKHFAQTVYKREKVFLGLIFAFAFVNWLLLSLTEKIGPPDFYKIYNVAEKLFSGNLKIDIIPPLFPLLLFPFGHLISLVADPADAFILAGRFLSLAAGLGVLYFTYAFLKKITGPFAIPAVLFMTLSPWFLKILAFPITDMLYLFFVTLVFYSFLNKSSPGWVLLGTVCGVLTRFEGVLLFPSAVINYFKLKKRNIYILLTAVPLLAGILFFFSRFAPRFYSHFKDIILAQKTYLFFFQHPLEFLNLIYGNILFFIPYSYPGYVKWTVWVFVLGLFGYGIYRLYKLEKSLTLALLFYELVFLISKGYVNTQDPEREFRRLFSGLWIFYIVAIIGLYFFLKTLSERKHPAHLLATASGALLLVLAFTQSFITPLHLLPVLLLVFPLYYALRTGIPIAWKRYIMFSLLILFAAQIYHTAYHKSEEYVVSYANKAAYAAAQWINLASLKENAVIFSYTNNTMIQYYLDHSPQTKKVELRQFIAPVRYNDEYHDSFIEIFSRQIKKFNVDYIIFDHYVVQKPEFERLNDIQRMLNEQINNRGLFRIRQNLTYKGKLVGYVLKPVNAKTNH